MPSSPALLVKKDKTATGPFNVRVEIDNFKEFGSSREIVVQAQPDKPVQSLLNKLGQSGVPIHDLWQYSICLKGDGKKMELDPLRTVAEYDITAEVIIILKL
jgi:hypothetical protein